MKIESFFYTHLISPLSSSTTSSSPSKAHKKCKESSKKCQSVASMRNLQKWAVSCEISKWLDLEVKKNLSNFILSLLRNGKVFRNLLYESSTIVSSFSTRILVLSKLSSSIQTILAIFFSFLFCCVDISFYQQTRKSSKVQPKISLSNASSAFSYFSSFEVRFVCTHKLTSQVH